MTLGDFSPQAAAYERSRPSYPAAAVDLALADVQVKAGDPVADIGAGTGIFTRLLAERGLQVAAVEPNDEMRQQATPLANVRCVKGSFENTTLTDGSQRWVVAAQAFHWADVSRSLPEIRRILIPGAAFTILWNDRLNDASEVLIWTSDAIRRHVPEHDSQYRECPWADILISTGDFSSVVHRQVNHSVWMSNERYLDLWRSHNRLNTQAGPGRFAAFMAELTAYLEAKGSERVEVPYACNMWTAR